MPSFDVTTASTYRAVMFDAFDFALARWCAPRSANAPLRILFRLCDRLQSIMPAAREPMLGAIKLAWWREQLAALDAAAPPAEPLLQEVATLLPLGLTGTQLSALAEEEPAVEVLAALGVQICGGDARASKLLQRLAADDHARTSIGRPLSSPARRFFMALTIRLLGA